MANVVYENKVLEAKAKDLLLTAINAKNFMTIDNELAQNAGMKKVINVYTYSGEAEELAAGVGNTTAKRGSISYTPQEYTVKMVQQAFDYLDESKRDAEIFQYYIISSHTAVELQEHTNEVILYNEGLDIYLLGVTHFGTSWDYVLTDIKIN